MAKSVRELMTANPCAIEADKSVAHAAKMMKDEDEDEDVDVGLAPIVEGDRLIGTVTDRDIAIRVVAEDKDPESITVREIASTDSNSRQGGTTAQKKAAGRKGGKASARKR